MAESKPAVRRAQSPTLVKCDMLGCSETHPTKHDNMTEPGFRFGRWLGWCYLDINRPDLRTAPLGFCSIGCLLWWIEEHTAATREQGVNTLRFHVRGR